MVQQLTHTARDAAYTAVGLGVLGFQRAQVRRRELERQLQDPDGPLSAQLSGARTELGRLARELDRCLGPVVAQLDEGLGRVQSSLPEPAAQALSLARQQADRARVGLISRLSPA